MPKQNKDTKGKRQKAGAATAQTNDDFDDMLAELCAADLTPPPAAGSTATANRPSSSGRSGGNSSSNPTPTARATRSRAEAGEMVSDMTMAQALQVMMVNCIDGRGGASA
jgi:hypothetical protein